VSGAVCSRCDPGRTCVDCPGRYDPVRMVCTECDGEQSDGCEACGGRGWEPVDRCPLSLVTPDVWELLTTAADAEAGYLPVAGGTLNQTHSWLTAWRRMRAEKAHWKRLMAPADAK